MGFRVWGWDTPRWQRNAQSERLSAPGCVQNWQICKVALISAILYLFATVSAIGMGWTSQRLKERNLHMFGGLLVAGIAFMCATGSVHLRVSMDLKHPWFPKLALHYFDVAHHRPQNKCSGVRLPRPYNVVQGDETITCTRAIASAKFERCEEHVHTQYAGFFS